MTLCMPLHGSERRDVFGFSALYPLLSQREGKEPCHALGLSLANKRQQELQFWEKLKINEEWLCLDSKVKLPLLEDIAKILQNFSSKEDFRYARHAHSYMCYLGVEDKSLLRDLVVSSFVKCGRISDARQILSRFPQESLCIWPALIERYVDGGEAGHALTLFLQVQCDCTQLSKGALQALIKYCTKLKSAKKAQLLHGNLVRGGLDGDILLATSLVEMYAKCGLLEESREILDEMPVRDVFAWNALSLAYAECGLDGESLQCLDWLKREGLSPNAVTFVVALKVCGKIDFLERGQELHMEIVMKGLESDNYIGSALSDMYGKCFHSVEAEMVLEVLQDKDVVSWTSLISRYTEDGQGTAALDCFEKMQLEGVVPNAVTYMGVLKACTSLGALTKGQKVHALIIEEGFEEDILIGGTLVDMYAKCAGLIEAQAVFEDLSIKNEISWTALLAGSGEHGLDNEVLNLVETMRNDRIQLGPMVFVYSLKACASMQAFQKGLSIHSEIVKEELEANVAISSALMDMYAKSGLLAEFEEVFREVSVRDVVLWTTRITCFLEHGLFMEAFICFEEMQIEGVSPNGVTCACILQACILPEATDVGREIHSRIVAAGFDKGAVVGNTLVDFYAKHGSIEETWKAFNDLAVKDVVSWNTLIAGLNEHEVGQEALNSLGKMKAEGFSPNKITFLSCLRTCGLLAVKEEGRRIHGDIIKMGYEGDILLSNTLVDMYIKSGSIVEADEIFCKMESRDVVSWNILVASYAEQQLGEQGLECLEQMVADGVLPNALTLVCGLKCCACIAAIGAGQELHSKILSEGHEIDPIVGSALVDMYASCGLLADASKLFGNLLVRNGAWNDIISGYAGHGQDEEVLSCYQNMLGEGGSPDERTFAGVLKACGNLGAIVWGQEVYMLATKKGKEDDALVGTMLIDMYSKCGCLLDASHLFEGLIEKDLVSWSVFVAGFAYHGDCEATLHFLEIMECSGVLPDRVALLSVLSACSHSGLVDLGQVLFQEMEERYIISTTAEHYNCMIDLHSRAGHLDVAMLMISQMPYKPSSMTWSTMLGACRNWGNSELGHYAFEIALKSDETDAAALYLMQSIYADSDLQNKTYNDVCG